MNESVGQSSPTGAIPIGIMLFINGHDHTDGVLSTTVAGTTKTKKTTRNVDFIVLIENNFRNLTGKSKNIE